MKKKIKNKRKLRNLDPIVHDTSLFHSFLFSFSFSSCSSLLFVSVPARKVPGLDTDYEELNSVLVCLGILVCLIVLSTDFWDPLATLAIV
jgi:hypothetical protein